MATNRYQHLRQRVSASGKPYSSSIASRSKRDDEKNRLAELELKKLAEWQQLNEKKSS